MILSIIMLGICLLLIGTWTVKQLRKADMKDKLKRESIAKESKVLDFCEMYDKVKK